MPTITLHSSQDRWRYTCSRGHRSWEAVNHHFWCQQCAQLHDVDPTFSDLHDRKTDQRIAREDIRLQPA